jgi:hypothetical protein
MRKLFWCCLVGGVVLIVGVFATVQLALRQPQSLLGQALYKTSQMVAMLNPLSRFSANTTRSRTSTLASGEEASEGPLEVVEPNETVPVTETTATMPIVIPEDEPVPAAAMPILSDALCPVRLDQAIADAECPPSDRAQVAPTRMPFCDEDEFETLPMPTVADDSEEQEESEAGATGSANQLLRFFQRMLKKNTPAEGGSEEKKSGINKVRVFKWMPADEWLPIHLDIDTMEFRPSDRNLHDYGPGTL